jgi:hypothetical protein
VGNRSEQIPAILAPQKLKPAPMVRATGPYLGPPHGAGRVAGGALEILRVPTPPLFSKVASAVLVDVYDL